MQLDGQNLIYIIIHVHVNALAVKPLILASIK